MSKGVDLRELKARRYGVFVVETDDTLRLFRDNVTAQVAGGVAPYQRLTLRDKREFIVARIIGVNRWERDGFTGHETFAYGPEGAIIRTIEVYPDAD